MLDGRDQVLDRLAVGGQLALQFLDLTGQLAAGGDDFAQPHECSHPEHAHLHGARRVQNRCRLDGAVLGEGERKIAASATSV